LLTDEQIDVYNTILESVGVEMGEIKLPDKITVAKSSKLNETRKEVSFGKPKLVYPCSYNY